MFWMLVSSMVQPGLFKFNKWYRKTMLVELAQRWVTQQLTMTLKLCDNSRRSCCDAFVFVACLCGYSRVLVLVFFWHQCLGQLEHRKSGSTTSWRCLVRQRWQSDTVVSAAWNLWLLVEVICLFNHSKVSSKIYVRNKLYFHSIQLIKSDRKD